MKYNMDCKTDKQFIIHCADLYRMYYPPWNLSNQFITHYRLNKWLIKYRSDD